MYRRYQPTQGNPRRGSTPSPHGQEGAHQSEKAHKPNKQQKERPFPNTRGKGNAAHPLLRFIPQSLYNPETGKVLGILSAEDLLLVALILIIVDSGDECEDNSMLIYALLYLLLSEHIDLPF